MYMVASDSQPPIGKLSMSMTMRDRLKALIRSDNVRLWDAVREAFDKTLNEILKEYGSAIPTEELASTPIIVFLRGTNRLREDKLVKALEPVFKREVIDRLVGLAPVTSADLTSIAIAQLTGLDWENVDEIDTGKRRFIAFALAELLATRQGEKRFSLNVDKWPWAARKDEEPWESDELRFEGWTKSGPQILA
jgi:hypothetical protein